MSIWKDQADKARADDYQPGSREPMLNRHMRANFPELVKELEKAGDYQDYLVTKVAASREMEFQLHDQGTDPHTARELAMADLLPTPPE